jgi:type IV pilus biogenesis protein CpaD/CtpE
MSRNPFDKPYKSFMIFIVIAILIGHSRSKEYCNSIGRDYRKEKPCTIRESEDQASIVPAQNKRNDKTIEQHTQYLVKGIVIGTLYFSCRSAFMYVLIIDFVSSIFEKAYQNFHCSLPDS